jgi:hypothetical protein
MPFQDILSFQFVHPDRFFAVMTQPKVISVRIFCTLFLFGLLFSAQGDTKAMLPPKSTLYTFDLTPLLSAPTNTAAERQQVWDELQFLVSIQALANREKPQLYFYAVGNKGSIDRFWLHWLQEPHQWLSNTPIKPLKSFDSVVNVFGRYIKGYVVWDDRVPSTSNVAATVAGAKSLCILRYDPASGSLYDRYVQKAHKPARPVVVRLLNSDGSSLFTGEGTIPGTDISSTGSAKDDAYIWAAKKYLTDGLCDPSVMAYYPDAFWIKNGSAISSTRTLLVNEDYFLSHRAFFFDLSPWDDEAPNDDPNQPIGSDAKTLQTILRIAYNQLHQKKVSPSASSHQASGMIMVGGFPPWDQKYTNFTGGKHEGVPTEWRYSEILSCFNAYMDADAPGLNAMANASAYCHYPLASQYPQHNLPTINSLTKEGLLTKDGKVAPGAYVAIYMGDYDSAAWLYQRMPDLWTDPVRGEIPLSWAFNPNLDRRFPVGLAYARQTAAAEDTFITGDSGAGYLNPGYLTAPRKWSGLPSGLYDWETHCERYYKLWDISVTGFLIEGYGPTINMDILKAYAHFSPGGIIGQGLPADQGLVENVPYIKMSSDLTGNPEQSAELIARDVPHDATSFHVYRCILWSPTAVKQMYERLKQLRPDVHMVNANSLLLLLKTYLKGK